MAFQRFSNAQAVNEESFQHLMAFLDNLEQLESQSNSPPQHMTYPIVFFLKDEHSSALVDGSAGSIHGLKRTQITLEAANYQRSLPSMRRSLGRLFDACNVEHSMEKLSEQATTTPKRYVSYPSLPCSVISLYSPLKAKQQNSNLIYFYDSEWKEEFSFSHFAKRVHETARQKAGLRLSVRVECALTNSDHFRLIQTLFC